MLAATATPDTLAAILYSPQTYGIAAAIAVTGVGWFRWQKLSAPEKKISKVFAVAAVTLSVAVGYVGYTIGIKTNAPQYRFLSYIDGQTVEVAKDMQAMCDQRQICKADEIRARWEDATGVGKLEARLR